MKFEIRHWGDPRSDDAAGMWVQFAAESAIHAYLERMPSRFEASFRLLFRFRSSVRPSLFAKLQLVCLCRRRVTSCRFAKLGQRCLDSAIQVHAACIRAGYLACRQLSLLRLTSFFLLRAEDSGQ